MISKSFDLSVLLLLTLNVQMCGDPLMQTPGYVCFQIEVQMSTYTISFCVRNRF